MTNEFMAAARRARVRVRSAQQRHEKWRARADRRFAAAQALHASVVARAEMTEAKAWMELLSVPGVTIPTAAALMEVSESTVSRWVARYNRGLEEERAAGVGGAP
ncbi:MAG: helix-turn-helix domain-containing protein [Candidatus Nanopelagicales bacterium]|nr:helix-turn-helix domain-containing protein [Candidatus Nanopelagicales bacterium]